MALVFQEYSRSLLPWMSVRGNVVMPLRHKKLEKAEAARLVEEAVDAVGLTDFIDRYPWQLSGGMQQRVAIARALAYQPEILLMDEPFASVDAQTRGDLEDLILQVRDRYDMTILFVTHDIDESVYLSDRIVVLSPSPTEVREILDVSLPHPRDQVETKELPGVRAAARARVPADQASPGGRRGAGARRVTAALLAAGTALCYGVSNFVGPRLVLDLPLYPVLISGQVVALVVSGALVVTEGGGPSAAEVAAAGVAGAGNAFALLAFYRAAALGPMSIVAPLGALGAVVPVTLGVAQGEPIGAFKVVAIVVALAGVALAARPARSEDAGDRRAAAAWALASSLGFGVFLAGMSEAGSGGAFWAIALSRVALLVVFVVVALRLSSPLRVAGRDLPRVMVPGLLLFAGTLLYTVATREGDLSVVSVIASLAPVVIVALAFTVLGERLSRSQALGAAAAMAGSVMLAAR